MSTILVTGGAGFLGSWFARDWLAAETGRVVVLDKLTYAGNLGSLESVQNWPHFVFRRGDIADRQLVARLLKEYEPAAIINFAAETHVDRSIDAPAPFVATNVVGTAQLLEAAHEYWRSLAGQSRDQFRFLHISTDEVFGPIAPPRIASETAIYRPSSPYAASKAAADHFVRSYHRTHGLPTLIVHPANCYGPFQFLEKLIPLTILNAIEGLPVPIFGDGAQQRDWLWGDDLCRAVRVVLQEGRVGESYNVASGTQRKNLDLVTNLCDLVDELAPDNSCSPRRALVTHVADRPGHDIRYALETTKIQELGWRSSAAFDEQLKETVRWYIANRA